MLDACLAGRRRFFRDAWGRSTSEARARKSRRHRFTDRQSTRQIQGGNQKNAADADRADQRPDRDGNDDQEPGHRNGNLQRQRVSIRVFKAFISVVVGIAGTVLGATWAAVEVDTIWITPRNMATPSIHPWRDSFRSQ